MVVEHFDRKAAIEFGIEPAIDSRHPTITEHFLDGVMREYFSLFDEIDL